MRNVEDIYQGMKQSLGRRYRIALLHGKMSAQEKDEVMASFSAGKSDILVLRLLLK